VRGNHSTFALGRLPAGQMNKTEAEYGDVLKQRERAGEVVWFKFEGLKLRLADNTFYTPDYAVILKSGDLELHEVKGHWQEDARVKIKIAAAMFPFTFIAVRKRTKKEGGGFSEEHF